MKLQCLVIMIMISVFSGISRADSIYAVTGTLTINGYGVPTPGTETLNFSFELGYQPVGTSYWPYIVPGTMDVTSVGPLGMFTGSSGGVIGFDTTGFIAFSGGILDPVLGRDSIDLVEIGGFNSPPDPPYFPGAYMDTCVTSICSEYFSSNHFPHLSGSAEATVAPVPEGSESAMLGITAIGILGAVKKRLLIARSL